MILIDTEGLKQLADLLSAANNDITRALSLLNQITEHYDWNCRERYQINEMTQNNRVMLQKVQADMENFVAVAHSVADGFVETEKGIRDLFPSVEGLIARIMSIPAALSVTAVSGGGICGQAVSLQKTLQDQTPQVFQPPVDWPFAAASAIEDLPDFTLVTDRNMFERMTVGEIGVCNLADLNL